MIELLTFDKADVECDQNGRNQEKQRCTSCVEDGAVVY